jgi:uncharacterized membrane protein
MEKHRWTNEEIAEYRKQHGGFGYFNRLDTRLFVPKAFGFGLTVNWANPRAWVAIAVIIAVIMCIKVFL